MGSGAAAESRERRTGRTAVATTTPVTATAVKCGGTDSAVEARPPSSAPARPPKLNRACSADITGRCRRCPSSTPRLFAATFAAPVAAPNTVRAAHSAPRSLQKPGATSESATSPPATDATRPGPKRAHHVPVRRMLISAPSETQNSAVPSAEWLAPTRSATSGTRAAQVPNTAPSRAKRMATAVYCRAGEKVRSRPGTRDRTADRAAVTMGNPSRSSANPPDVDVLARAGEPATARAEQPGLRAGAPGLRRPSRTRF
ncbi:hypothetical protein GCM10009539_07480 [Cryptosporangium japonicum]|uniref:Uncharacterized protein n=1 Tax=Cryptosporangium japonicum TaxID=80872 RepID=A0ABP3D6P2_9ACTN